MLHFKVKFVNFYANVSIKQVPRMKTITTLIILIMLCMGVTGQPINRKALVERHNVINLKYDSLSSLTLGNGGFAFTTDITGLQSFPEAYSNGVPLGTQSQWGWQGFTDTAGYRFEESLKTYHLNNRDITYAVQWHTPERNKRAGDWFRQNVHRLQLGNIGFGILKKDGQPCTLQDIQQVKQELDLWNGLIKSHFTVEGIPVDVITTVHPQQDIVSVKVNSSLVKEGRLKIRIRFPYPTGEFADAGINRIGKHHAEIIQNTIIHQLDNYKYYVQVAGGHIIKGGPNEFFVTPDAECSFRFSEKQLTTPILNTQTAAATYWNNYWSKGGMVDFTGSKDPRAFELERRIILSQYLMAVQCAGNMPPQETGLTYNSWYGKPHLEMYWWHAVHFALWNRIDLLEKGLQWYATVAGKAKAIAVRQGYEGIRWQKMTDPQGNESPSSVGAFLIWQQPHYIYMTELVYRHYHNRATLDKYKDLVFATADFMASYAAYDSNRYVLGKGLIPAQERFKPEETFNPTFELAYWRWGLRTAQQWRERLGLPRNAKWDEVLNKLSALPQQNGVYLATESAKDSYTNPVFMTDHPAVLGALGMLPASTAIDTAIMHNTFNKIWDSWNWKETWGWDFPLTSMTATRLGLRNRAIDALFMPVQTNTWLPNGHNYQDERLRLYLPGNGGLLTAVALMCAGYDGCSTKNPGIPDDGTWTIKWEGLLPMP
jgi:hypothetical protein